MYFCFTLIMSFAFVSVEMWHANMSALYFPLTGFEDPALTHLSEGVPGIHVLCSLEVFSLSSSSWSSAVSLWRVEILQRDKKHQNKGNGKISTNNCCFFQTVYFLTFISDNGDFYLHINPCRKVNVVYIQWVLFTQTAVTHRSLRWAAWRSQVSSDFRRDSEAATVSRAALASSSLLCSSLMVLSYSDFTANRSLL